MNRFTVVWDETAEQPFILYWVNGDARTRSILTEVANWIDSNLACFPELKGKPHPDLNIRIVSVPVSDDEICVSASFELLPR